MLRTIIYLVINVNSATSRRGLIVGGLSVFIFLAAGKAIKSSATLPNFQIREITIVEKLFPAGAIEIVKIHNSQSESFPKDFKIEIKNVSKKPIYYVNFSGRLPKTKPLYDGLGVGFHIFYGNSRLITNRTLAGPEDVPILPGETGMMTIQSSSADSLYKVLMKTGQLIELTSKVVLVPQFVNFGDGSGYQWEKPYGEVKEISSNLWDDCGGGIGGSCAKWQTRELTSGCGLENCSVYYNFSNVGGESCSEVCQNYEICTDQYGEEQMCRNVDLFPCGWLCFEV